MKRARPSERGARPHSNQQLPTISTIQLNFPPPPHMAWDLLLLPAPTADPSSLLTPRPWGTTHSSPKPRLEEPTWDMLASVSGFWWTIGDHPGRRTLLQFLNLLGFGGNCVRKFSCFSVRVGAWCAGLPAGLPIKENLGDTSLQSTASDGHLGCPRNSADTEFRGIF